MTKFDTRLHLIALASEAPEVEAALDKIALQIVRFVPSPEVKSAYVVASGQWTAVEAAALREALVAWPGVIIERGYADGAEDAQAVRVEPGDDASGKAPEEVRKSFRRVVAEWAAKIADARAVEAAEGEMAAK